MIRNTLLILVVALVAAGAGYFLARAMSPAQPVQSGTGLTGADSSASPRIDDLLGQRRPDFSLTDTAGREVSATDFDGQVWLLNFWATWCKPCVEEMPMLSQLQQDYAGIGLRVVGIALDDPDRASKFVADLGIDYPVLVGKTDVVLTGRRYGNATGMLPFSVIVDAAGIIRWSHLGAVSHEALMQQLSNFD
jgi:peroxiredoxin